VTPSGARRVARHDGIDADERRELALLEQHIGDHIRARGLQLTRRGERALQRGDLPLLRQQGASDPEPEPLLETRELAHLIRADLLVVEDGWKGRYARYVDLIGRSDTMTVALFVRPLAP
jgi:hypothetical protein